MSNRPLELVRVKDPDTGAETNMSRAHAKRAGVEILDKPARDEFGRPLPAKLDPLRRSSSSSSAPTDQSTHADIDAYAAAKGVDLAGASTKSEKLAAIEAAANPQEV